MRERFFFFLLFENHLVLILEGIELFSVQVFGCGIQYEFPFYNLHKGNFSPGSFLTGDSSEMK